MNIANQVTVGRIVLTFVFIGLALTNNQFLIKIAYMVGIIAGTSDFVDGYLARKYNLVSDFGIFMDPLADKIFIISAFIVLLHLKIAPVGVVLVVLIREFIVTGLRLIAAEKQIIISANFGGKVKTCLQFAYLAVIGAVWADFISENMIIVNILMYATIIVTTYTGIEYLLKYSGLYMKDL